MGAPNVDVIVEEGGIETVENTPDGVCGFIGTGIAATSLALGASKQIFSLADAEALGITAAYDTTNTTNIWKEINNFYSKAGTGKELWIMIVAKTTTMAMICDKANNMLKKLVDDSEGRVKFVGVTRVPDVSYTPVYAGQLDPDVLAAAAKAHELYADLKAAFRPSRTIIDGRDFQGTQGSLTNLKQSAYSTVQVLLSTDVSGSKNAAIGLLLGRYAAIPVQRNPGRVKSGDLGVQASFLTGTAIDSKTFTLAQINALHDKGYVFLRKYPAKNGYYFNDDPTCAPASSDFSSFARGRVIDKAIVLAYTTYVEEILDDFIVDENGFMLPALVKSYQAKIKSNIDLLMTAKGECSRCRVEMNAKQNVIATGKVMLKLFITPVAYGKELVVTLAFENPANA